MVFTVDVAKGPIAESRFTGLWPKPERPFQVDAELAARYNRVGATLRVDPPKPNTEISYAKMVARYLSHDTSAESVLFAVYTSEPMNGDHKRHTTTIAALTGALAERDHQRRTPRRRPNSVTVRRRH
ncbi:hypothetical protein [Pseudarthrobacter sp. C4D7]|uniref:hypothetical protein n=1 Tax=Pseudarthrobacter sp. C4D7 TaxID=2735268 RepID=UPI0020C7E703|nr:hypothetical protein [Pseudarthrobacter sp. C4D7]